MDLGHALKWNELGVSFYVFLQIIGFGAAISLFLVSLEHFHTPRALTRTALALYCLCPVFIIHGILIAGDSLMAMFFLWFMLVVFWIYKTEGEILHNRWFLAGFVLITFLFCASKNQCSYIVVLSGVLMLVVLRRKWKQVLIAFLLPLFIFEVLYMGLFFRLMHVNKVGSQEALSFFFQQTARTVKYHEDELTEEEKESCPQPLKDEEDGEVYDGAAYFEMPGDDVIIKAIYKRLDESDQEIKEKNVSSLVLDRTSVELQLGDGAKYILSVNAVVSTSGEGKEPELTFKCSDSSVVSMTQTGNTATLKARKEGEAILWAGCGDKVVKCDVTVKAGPVEVSVTNGKALNKDGSAVTKAEKNDELTLQYNAPSKGYKFKKWTIKGAASISGDTGDPNATVKIRVGSRAITAEAVYVIDDSYDEEFKPKDADVPVKKLTLSNKEYYLITGEEFNLTAEAVYDEKKPDIEFKCSNTDVVTIAADKTGEGKARAVVRSLKAGEATVYVYCGNKVEQCKVYVSDEAKGIALEDYKDILIDLKAGEQIALNATLMPESSVKQVASVKFQILNKFDAGSLNAPLKNMIDDYPELKALSGKKLPAVASASKGLITAKWPNKLTAAGMTSCMTVLRVTVKLVKDKGEKKAVEYVCDYPIRVSATDYETKRYKNTINDKDYKLSAKAARSTLDTAFEDRRGTVVTAVISKAEKKDNLTFEFTSTNENIISIENAQETAIPDAKGSKAFATAEVKAKGIGTAYVIVRSKDKTDDKKYNLSVVKITVKSGNPELILVNDSENLLPRDPNTNKIKIDPATNSVTIKMKQGSYDRFFIDLKPYVTEYSTDATKLAWSASGGVTVKNGVVYAKKATKEGKPARVIIKCAKSKPITIYINVK